MMNDNGVLGFTGSRIDRADAVRQDAARVAALAADPDARLLLLDGLDPVLDDEGMLQWLPLPLDAENPIFLGLDNGMPRFAPMPGAGVSFDARSRAVWRLIARMPADQSALYGGARSIIDWHARHGFCARCGAPTQPAKAGWQRNCGSCGAEHFPRTDPVVIMLAEHDGAVLVGRQSFWPARQYSALAGFVEPGESLEEAVARELEEEAGVRTRAVRYVASQPWPFPSSLMIGCFAEVESRDLLLDTNELESAIWVDRQAVALALAGVADAPFLAPQPFAIANSLFRRWLADG